MEREKCIICGVAFKLDSLQDHLLNCAFVFHLKLESVLWYFDNTKTSFYENLQNRSYFIQSYVSVFL